MASLDVSAVFGLLLLLLRFLSRDLMFWGSIEANLVVLTILADSLFLFRICLFF